jgi:hypothetical protein
MTPEVVHHVALGAETLSAVLGALERAVVVVHTHVDGQVMPVVKGFLARGHSADKVSARLVVGQVSLEELQAPKLLLAGFIAAPEHLCAALMIDVVAVFQPQALLDVLGIEGG